MQTRPESMEVVRREILDLLHQQMDALDSPTGLSDSQLRECYLRQGRVQELREILQAASSEQQELSAASAAHAMTAPTGAASAGQYV